jgi:hypothetical protein
MRDVLAAVIMALVVWLALLGAWAVVVLIIAALAPETFIEILQNLG